jgi:hypothetical protein
VLDSVSGDAEQAEGDEDGASALALAGGVLHLLGNTEYVPTGPLTLSERLAVDLALSEELARRSGRVAGRL